MTQRCTGEAQYLNNDACNQYIKSNVAVRRGLVAFTIHDVLPHRRRCLPEILPCTIQHGKRTAHVQYQKDRS